MEKTDLGKFHGMRIVSDMDQKQTKNKGVLELTSESNLVYREYDENMYEVNTLEVDLFEGMKNGKMTESNCVGGIIRQIGKGYHILISESVVNLIKNVTQN